MGEGAQVRQSVGGNDMLIAKGGAFLVRKIMRRQQQQEEERQAAAAGAGPSSRAGGVSSRKAQPNGASGASGSSSSSRHAEYVDLLPDMWSKRLGVHLAAWVTFSRAQVRKLPIGDVDALQQRIFPAAVFDDSGEPDYETRQEHSQKLQAYFDWVKAGAPKGSGPQIDDYVPVFYSILPPETTLPCGPVALPWPLKRNPTEQTLSIKLYKLDVLAGQTDEVEAGRWSIQAPKHDDHSVEVSVVVDEEGHIKFTALLKERAGDAGTPVEVDTDHDRLAAERRDRQKRVMELTPSAWSFLSQPMEASNAAEAGGAAAAAAVGGGGAAVVAAPDRGAALSGNAAAGGSGAGAARAASFGADLTACDAAAAAAEKKGGGKGGVLGAGAAAGAMEQGAGAGRGGSGAGPATTDLGAAAAASPMAQPEGSLNELHGLTAAVAVERPSGGQLVVPGLPAIGPAAWLAWGLNQPPSQMQLPGASSPQGLQSTAAAASVKRSGGVPVPCGSHRKHPRKSHKVRHVPQTDSGNDEEDRENGGPPRGGRGSPPTPPAAAAVGGGGGACSDGGRSHEAQHKWHA